MALQSIKSGAFKFSSTVENRDKLSTPGTIIISVDEDTNLTGDIRVHDGITPGGISAPPPGTISYIITERKMIREEWTANTDPSFVTASGLDGDPAGADIVNTPELGWIEFDTNYPANGDLLNGPYKFFRIKVELPGKPTLGGLGEEKYDINDTVFELTNIHRRNADGYQYPFPAECTATTNIRPAFDIDGTDYATYELDVSTQKLRIHTNNIAFPIETGAKVILEYVDGETGFQDTDGWFYCDGRVVDRREYGALFNEISDLWNSYPYEFEILDGTIDESMYPFQDFVTEFASGYDRKFEVNFSLNRCDVYKNDIVSNVPGPLYRVDSSQYRLGQNNSGQTFVEFIASAMPQTGEKIYLIGTPDSNEFQIPDLRGYYLRAWNDNTDIYGNQYIELGIKSKEKYAIQKHAHFIITAQEGDHTHRYTPWEFGALQPLAIAVWGNWPSYCDSNSNYVEGLEDAEFYGKWRWNATDADIEAGEKSKMNIRINQVGIGGLVPIEIGHWYYDRHASSGYTDWSLDAFHYYSQDHVTYVLGSGPTNMAVWDNGSGTENITMNWRHKHLFTFAETIIDTGGLTGINNQAISFEGTGHTDYDSIDELTRGRLQPQGRLTKCHDEVNLTHVKLPTFIKY